MNRKIFYTSLIALVFVMPAFAVPTNTSDSFNGTMLEDYTYTGAATYANLHSYVGPVSVTANYTPINYTVTAGNYLPQNGESVVPCATGGYCPGLQNTVQYSDEQDQGIISCPEYYTSDSGASADTQCYHACDTSNIGTSITPTTGNEHATAMTGRDYYNGTASDTCVPSACENGWHVNPGINLIETIGLTRNAWFSGTVNNEGSANEYASQLGLKNNGEFAISFDDADKGTIHGYARCSNVAGTNNNGTWSNPTILTADQLGAEGWYCYCQIDGYTPKGGTQQSFLTPFVYVGNTGASYCVRHCTTLLGITTPAFREVMFKLVADANPPFCEANVIQISWGGADEADIIANNAGTCTYGGDVRTPVKAQHIPGMTFVGWRVAKQSDD